jgi:hypothetical protein
MQRRRGGGDEGWQRAAALGGAVSVILIVVEAALQNDLPRSTASTGKVASFYLSSSHWHRVEAGLILGALSIPFFLSFVGLLRTRLRAAEGEPGRVAAVAFGAGLVFSALFAVLNGARGAVAVALDVSGPFRHGGLDPQLVRLTSELSAVVFVHALVVGAVLVGACSVVALRTGLWPGWLAWAGAVVAVLVLVGAFVAGGVAVYLLLLWILVVSLLLATAPSGAGPAPGPVGTPAGGPATSG